MPVGYRCATHPTPLYPQMLALKFTDQLQSISQYSLLAIKSHGVSFFVVFAVHVQKTLLGAKCL
jgi:hypothetical protein